MHASIHPASFAMVLFASTASCTSTDSSPSDGTTSADGTGSTDGATSNSGMEVTPVELLAGGNCDPAEGTGVEHSGDIVADEVWTAQQSPHRVVYHTRILATVTIEPCATVLLDPGVELDVGSSTSEGQLIARGQANDDVLHPVILKSRDPDQPWGRLLVTEHGTLDLSLAVILNGGGATTGEPGALVVRGDAGGTAAAEIRRSTSLDRVLIRDSAAHGLVLSGWGATTEGSSDVWIYDGGSDAAPAGVLIEPGVASTLPERLHIQGNLRDEISMRTSKAFSRDDTLVNHGVPYRQQGPLYVAPAADGAPVTLTIEPGVILKFDESAGSGMYVGSTDLRQGILIAEGTAEAPILLTSGREPAASGDWMGVILRYLPGTPTSIRHARVEYAGGESGTSGFGCGPTDNDAAIIVHGQGSDELAPAITIEDSEFEHIGGDTAIVSGWVGDGGPDFTHNSFGRDTGPCKVSRPQRTGGGDTCDGGRTTCVP